MTPPQSNYELKIILTPPEYQLAIQTQKDYEKIFNKYISLEDLFKQGLFYTKNINIIKLAILDEPVANEISKKTTNKTFTKKTKKNLSKNSSDPISTKKKKRVIPFKHKPEKQIKLELGGFQQ